VNKTSSLEETSAPSASEPLNNGAAGQMDDHQRPQPQRSGSRSASAVAAAADSSTPSEIEEMKRRMVEKDRELEEMKRKMEQTRREAEEEMKRCNRLLLLLSVLTFFWWVLVQTDGRDQNNEGEGKADLG